MINLVESFNIKQLCCWTTQLIQDLQVWWQARVLGRDSGKRRKRAGTWIQEEASWNRGGQSSSFMNGFPTCFWTKSLMHVDVTNPHATSHAPSTYCRTRPQSRTQTLLQLAVWIWALCLLWYSGSMLHRVLQLRRHRRRSQVLIVIFKYISYPIGGKQMEGLRQEPQPMIFTVNLNKLDLAFAYANMWANEGHIPHHEKNPV